jgi:hypothetical protein
LEKTRTQPAKFFAVEFVGNAVEDRTFPMILTLILLAQFCANASQSLHFAHGTCQNTEKVTLESNKRLV